MWDDGVANNASQTTQEKDAMAPSSHFDMMIDTSSSTRHLISALFLFRMAMDCECASITNRHNVISSWKAIFEEERPQADASDASQHGLLRCLFEGSF
jgi:hypothetical protein